MFGHRWRIDRVLPQDFQTVERCTFCDRTRWRTQRPRDEAELGFQRATEEYKVKTERLRREIWFEARKGRDADQERIRRAAEKLKALKRPSRR